METINRKLNSYSTNGNYSLMSFLLNNILKNSTINDKSYFYIQSVTLE